MSYQTYSRQELSIRQRFHSRYLEIAKDLILDSAFHKTRAIITEINAPHYSLTTKTTILALWIVDRRIRRHVAWGWRVDEVL
jgi:hypothetical protein